MGYYQSQNTCPTCERAFSAIQAGGPCSTCQRCCECCSCQSVEFSLMQEEVRSLYTCDMVDLSIGDDPFFLPFKADMSHLLNMNLCDKNSVKIAIWPYTMDDDEIVFDPETGKLTDEVAQKVEHYLQLNMAMIPPDEEISHH